MALKARFSIFENVGSSISTLVSKFGGQPVWLNSPSWPLDPVTNEQMLFLCQLDLVEPIFSKAVGTMVYIFVSDAEIQYDEGIAVIIQSGTSVIKCADSEISFVSKAKGPSIYEIRDDGSEIEKEYRLEFESVENETDISLEEIDDIFEIDLKEGYRFFRPEFSGNKMGGLPIVIGGFSNLPEFYSQEDWHLLLQLAPIDGYWNNREANFFPFHMELGEFGILTIFISKDYTQAVAYVQQP
ncbi:MAG: DUF1963 domain-containing protein [Bacteroidota bacterium]